MKTAAYYRRSTDIQRNSIETQRQKAIECSIKTMNLIEEEYIDDAISGKLSINERPNLKRLLQDIENGVVTKVLVYKRDRLARNALQYLDIYHLLKEKKVEVIFTADNELPLQYTPVGELFELIMAGIIQREGEQIVERISETIKARFQKGEYAGNLPYGYSYDKATKKIIRNEEELTEVKMIYDALLSGKSIKEIKTTLEERSAKKNGKPWTVQSIRNIITNTTYMGERLLHISGETIKTRYDQLSVIDIESWLKAQKIVDGSKSVKATVQKQEIKFILCDLLICRKCNHSFVGKSSIKKGEQINSYECKEHKNLMYEKGFIEKYVYKKSVEFFKELINSQFDKLFERYLKNSLKTISDNISLIDSSLKQANNQLFMKTEKWNKEKNQDRKSKIEEDLLVLFDKVNELEKMKNNLLEEMNQLNMLQIKTNDQIDKFLSPNIFPSDVTDSLIKDIVEKIVIDDYFIEVVFKHPFFHVKEAISIEAS